ncbi:MAG: hypothetical protein DWI00_09665 [Planctomycetota bacterium]|nr:MAG: hypothetical protein DWI00_09665 [Planctomycetota bacterium]
MRHYQEPMPIRSDRIIQITEKTDGNDARAGCWLDAGTPAFAGKSCRTGRRNQVSPTPFLHERRSDRMHGTSPPEHER